ncbi:hypothetical protein [Tsukamurella spumae]|uniref:4Fe-4S Wbl-type domain-containing protein n=1 Tax=Tsukamurella spumae TaxID=44753 RepID=A0A846X5C3_9ACTN|nr:hypothetical protein [Tsukamurella spumae]NKY19509.1 hypothetical protein [Tsukamurella spumae]
MTNRGRKPLAPVTAQVGACASLDPDRWHNLGRESPESIRRMYGACARCPIIDMCRSQLAVHLEEIAAEDGEPLKDTLWAGQFFGKRGTKVHPSNYLGSRSKKVTGFDAVA